MKKSLLSGLTEAEKRPESGWSFYSSTDSTNKDDVCLLEFDTRSEESGSQESDSPLSGSPRCRSEEDKSPSDFKSTETSYRIPKKSGNKQLSSIGFESSFHSNQNGEKTEVVAGYTRPSLRRGTHSPDNVASRLNRQRNVGRTGTKYLSTKNRTNGSEKCSKLSEFMTSDKTKPKQGCKDRLRRSSRWRYAKHPVMNRNVQCSAPGDDDVLEVLSKDKDDINAAKPSFIGTRTRSRLKETSKACNDVSIKDDKSLHNSDNNSSVVLSGLEEDSRTCDEDILMSVDQNPTSKDTSHRRKIDDLLTDGDCEDIFFHKETCTHCIKRHSPGKCQRKKNICSATPCEAIHESIDNWTTESDGDYEDLFSSKKMCIHCVKRHSPGKCQRKKNICSATPRKALRKDSYAISTNSFYSNNDLHLDIECTELPSEKIKTYSPARAERRRKATTGNATNKKRNKTESDSDVSECKSVGPRVKRKWKNRNPEPAKIQSNLVVISDEEEKEKDTASRTSDDEKQDMPYEVKLKEGHLKKPKPSRRILSKKTSTESQDEEHDKAAVHGFQRDNLNVNILLGKTVRIGTFVVYPTAPLKVTSKGITLKVDTEGKEISLPIHGDELESLQINPTEEPRILVLAVNQNCALRTKSWAHLKGRGFNPGSMVQAERNIVLEVAEEIPSETQADLLEWVNEKLSKTYSEISPDKAEEILNMVGVPKREVSEGQLKANEHQGSSSVRQNHYHTRCRNSRRLNEPVKNLITYPRPPVQGGITVTSRDTECLTPGEFLNDVVIDFYLKYIFHEKLGEADRQRTYIFSSYFYKRLTQQKYRHGSQDEIILSSQVHKWTRNVDIFEKDFLIVPVNQSLHWFLAIICFPGQKASAKVNHLLVEDDEKEQEEEVRVEKGIDSEDDDIDFGSAKVEPVVKTRPSIILFDSLGSGGRALVFGNLRNYLSAEWRERRQKQHGSRDFSSETIKGSYAKVPLQDNHCDCGVFVLQYVESFFEDPIRDYCETPIEKVDWFPLSKIAQKRQNILDLIHQLNRKEEGQD